MTMDPRCFFVDEGDPNVSRVLYSFGGKSLFPSTKLSIEQVASFLVHEFKLHFIVLWTQSKPIPYEEYLCLKKKGFLKVS